MAYPRGGLRGRVHGAPGGGAIGGYVLHVSGVLTGEWRALAIGLLMGISITFLNAWLSDRFLDPWIARFQRPLQKSIPRIFANIAAFAWAIALCALSILAPIAVLGS